MNKISRDDHVIVLAGKDKGKTGVVVKYVKTSWLIVQGINLAKKHVKGNPQNGVSGGIVEKETPIHVSNVSLYNKSTSMLEKVAVKFMEDGKKVRYFKSSGEVVGY
ncbi:50S ribosomal subunit protein L24 [Gammaproteobacteria bacterium]